MTDTNRASSRVSIDFAYSLQFLKKLNALTSGGKPIPELFTHLGFDLWQSYQQILFERIKGFSKTRTVVHHTYSFWGRVKDVIACIFASVLVLVSLLWCMIKRPRVAIYSIDRTNSRYRGDFRLTELYEALAKQKVSFVEIFHTVLGKETFSRFFYRGRSALYLEFPDWIHAVGIFFRFIRKQELSWIDGLDLSSFDTSEEKEFARSLLLFAVDHASRSQFRIRWWRRLFSLMGIRTLFAIDDARYYLDLILAAKKTGIPTYAIQHGHFTKYHVGWLTTSVPAGTPISPDILLVWTTYWKKELLRLGSSIPIDHIKVGGFKVPLQLENKEKRDEKMTRVLVPYEIDAPKEEVATFIRALIQCGNVEVIIKLRPDKTMEEQLASYGLEKPLLGLSVINDTNTAMGLCDVVVGTYSTFLYETLWYEKPVALFETSIDFGEGMVENGLANRISRDNPCEDLVRLREMSQEERVARKEKLFGKESVSLTTSIENILSEMSA